MQCKEITLSVTVCMQVVPILKPLRVVAVLEFAILLDFQAHYHQFRKLDRSLSI